MKTIDNFNKANFSLGSVNKVKTSSSWGSSPRESFVSIIKGLNRENMAKANPQKLSNNKEAQEEPTQKEKEPAIACVYINPQQELLPEDKEADLHTGSELSKALLQVLPAENFAPNTGAEISKEAKSLSQEEANSPLEENANEVKLNKAGFSVLLPEQEAAQKEEVGRSLPPAGEEAGAKEGSFTQMSRAALQGKGIGDKQSLTDVNKGINPERFGEEPLETAEKPLIVQEQKGGNNPLITSQGRQIFELYQKLAQGRLEGKSPEENQIVSANSEALANPLFTQELKPEIAALPKESHPSLVQETKTFIQIAEKLPTHLNEGLTSIKIKLSPEGLGEVTVSLICREGKVSLDIVAAMASTQKLLESQSGDLRAALQARDYEISGLNISSNQDNHFEDSAFSRHNSASQEFGSQEKAFSFREIKEGSGAKQEVIKELVLGRRLNYKA